MASKALAAAVSSSGTEWDFACSGQVPFCAFTSTGWPTRKVAEARGAEHFAEHNGDGLMSDLGKFREAHGLTDEGKVGN